MPALLRQAPVRVLEIVTRRGLFQFVDFALWVAISVRIRVLALFCWLVQNNQHHAGWGETQVRSTADHDISGSWRGPFDGIGLRCHAANNLDHFGVGFGQPVVDLVFYVAAFALHRFENFDLLHCYAIELIKRKMVEFANRTSR